MKQETLQLTGANYKGSRRELDFYPTPVDVTIALLDFLKIPKTKLIWEPACGNGAMSTVFKNFGYAVIETDIATGDDYLKTFREADAIITNPPFNLSDQFIEKSILNADLVGMLLKSQYWHAKKRLDLFKSYPPRWVLPLTWRPDFLAHERKPGEKGSPTMEVIWCVWDKNNPGPTEYVPLAKPHDL